jgi:hypothetical protein
MAKRRSAQITAAGQTPAAVTIRTADGLKVDIQGGADLDQAALAWCYIARHRVRLEGSRMAREDLAERSAKALYALGVGSDDLRALATSRLIEVSIPFSRDNDNWAARIMPWEGLLGAATSQSTATPLVVRHLACGRTTRPSRRGRKAAVVLGAVEALGDYYSFDTERRVASKALGIKVVPMDNLTRDQLEADIAAESPDVIHVGGVDVHQGTDYFDLGPIERFDDGMVLINEERDPVAVPAADLASALTAGRRKKPALVAFNLYYSAARIAALTVANGADVAIGFQDRFDDLAAESFLGELYRAWQSTLGDPLVSLYVAWMSLWQRSELSAWTRRGLVMWSARSLLTMGIKELSAKADGIVRREEKSEKAKPFSSLREAIRVLNVTVKPLERLNYALMHNRRPMFDAFELRNLDEHRRISDVHVEVELFAGTERLPYRRTLVLDNAPESAGDRIFIPLTSTLVRSLKESVRASLRVKVSVGSLGVHEDSYRVTLLPTDEWVDNDDNRQWLPSFVLPQDPAVERVIGLARPFLTFLTDAASAGFDGYQSIDAEADDATGGVDVQVEAIWSALVALPLAYINPPPTYTDQSQRLRFPSRILRSGDGTCIDLALLFASCLEQVNIYPVVFLLKDHAFPGYWRSDQAWNDFISMRPIQALKLPALERLTEESGTVCQEYAWVFPSSFHAEIMKQIEDGNLVPLETVWITTRGKFAEAQDTGWENLLKASEFEGLIDITLARDNDVTPLPSREGDA